MQCATMRTMVPSRLSDVPCTSRVQPRAHHAFSQVRRRPVVRIVHAHNTPDQSFSAESAKPAPFVAQIAAGAAIVFALFSCDRAEAADSSGRISGSTFASRRTGVQTSALASDSIATSAPSTASFTRNSSNINNNTTNVNSNTTNVNHSTTNVNHTSVNHTTTHVNHTTVVVAPPAPIIPIPIPVVAPVVAAPVIVAEPVVVAGGAVVAAAPVVAPAPVVVHQQSSMVTTIIGLLAVILLLYIIAQVISAFSGNKSY